MSSETLPEVVDRELDVAPVVEINAQAVDRMIAVSKKLPEMARAIEAIRLYGLKATLPGDFARFGDKVELTGPGSERVLSAVGMAGVNVSFTEWSYFKDTGTDKNGDYYYWWYSAKVEIGCLRLGLIQGRAGSRDLFFGKERGAWKDLGDVREADIRMAARRGVFKEALKVAFGLRGIPYGSCSALGIDVSKIKTVEFGSGGNTAAAAPAAKAGTALFVKEVSTRNIKKKDGGTTTVYVIEDENGTKYETFSESIAKEAKALKLAAKKAIFDHEANGKYAPKLKSISGAGDSQPDPEPAGDAQDDGEPQG